MNKIKITEADIQKLAMHAVNRILKESGLGFGYDAWKTGQNDPKAPFNQHNDSIIYIAKNDFPDEMNGGEELEQKIFQLGGQIDYDAMGQNFQITGNEMTLDKIVDLLDSYGVEYDAEY